MVVDSLSLWRSYNNAALDIKHVPKVKLASAGGKQYVTTSAMQCVLNAK